MLPCLAIRLSQTTLNRPPPLLVIHRPNAVRKGTVVLPPAEIGALHSSRIKIDESAVEFLCQLGFTAIDATTLLTQTGSSVDAVRIQAVCETLLRVTKVPVARLPGILRQSPQLLSLDPQAISEHYESLSRAWPSQRQLQKIVITYSDVLKPSFATALRRCMAALEGMGFSKAQTAAAVTSCPKLAGVRHYQMVASLTKCGLPSKIEDSAMFELLSKNPDWLTPEGSRTLDILLETVRKGTGLAPDKVQFIVARAKHINLRKKREIGQIMGLLRRFGFSQSEIANMCVEWPSLCSQSPSKVDRVLKVLKFYEQSPEKVAQFPKVFLCKPLQTIGPRLAFLQQHNPSALPSLALSTTLGSSDARFLQLRASKEVFSKKKCDFDAFKEDWLAEHEWWASDGDDDEQEGSSSSSGSEEERETIEGNRGRELHQHQQQQEKTPPVAAAVKTVGRAAAGDDAGVDKTDDGKQQQQQQQQKQRALRHHLHHRRNRHGNNNSNSFKNEKPKFKSTGQQLQRLTVLPATVSAEIPEK